LRQGRLADAMAGVRRQNAAAGESRPPPVWTEAATLASRDYDVLVPANAIGLGTVSDPDASTGFTVADAEGNAVVCLLTMGAPFGRGRLTDEGFLQAAVSPGPPPLIPAIVVARSSHAPVRAAALVNADLPQWISDLDRAVGGENGWQCRNGLPAGPGACRVSLRAPGDGAARVILREEKL
jgi:hypothetical protein